MVMFYLLMLSDRISLLIFRVPMQCFWIHFSSVVRLVLCNLTCISWSKHTWWVSADLTVENIWEVNCSGTTIFLKLWNRHTINWIDLLHLIMKEVLWFSVLIVCVYSWYWILQDQVHEASFYDEVILASDKEKRGCCPLWYF